MNNLQQTIDFLDSLTRDERLEMLEQLVIKSKHRAKVEPTKANLEVRDEWERRYNTESELFDSL